MGCGHCVVDHNPNARVSDITAVTFSVKYFNPLKLYPVSGNIFRKWFASYFFELCIKFGSNICYSHWDRRHFDPDIHLMTSRELTSSFDFWSRGHLRIAVVHLRIKFGADIFIQSGVIDFGGCKPTFLKPQQWNFARGWNLCKLMPNFVYKKYLNVIYPFWTNLYQKNTNFGDFGGCKTKFLKLRWTFLQKFKMADAAILVFKLSEFGTFHHVYSIVLDLYTKFGWNICIQSLRSTSFCSRHSFDDVTRINFRFRLLVMWPSA